MHLMFVIDNGFCLKEGIYYGQAAHLVHVKNLHAFFDKISIIARDDSYASGYQEMPDYVDVTLVPKYNIWKLKRVLRKKIKECDAAFCYGANGYYASIVAKKAGKVVISYNGGDQREFCLSRGNLKGRLLAPIAGYMCKKSFDNADFGHYCDEFLIERYPTKGEMLACSAVDVTCYEKSLEDRIQKIQSLDLNGIVRVGLTGHTKNAQKGIDLAIKAMAELGDQYILEIAGRGETEEYMSLAEKLGCAKRIHFLGALGPEQLMNWLDTLDIYVQPSRIEGLPRATIEAMSRACPVVSSNAGALMKLVDSQYVFNLRKPEKFSTLIRKLSDQKEMLEQANKNFEKSKKYERKVRDPKYQAFYTKVVDEIKRRKSM